MEHHLAASTQDASRAVRADHRYLFAPGHAARTAWPRASAIGRIADQDLAACAQRAAGPCTTVRSGGPKLRAVTTSRRRQAGDRLPEIVHRGGDHAPALVRDAEPRTARRRKSVRFARRSTSSHPQASGSTLAITSPGRPPPEPRSTTPGHIAARSAGRSARRARRPRSTASGPTMPSRCVSRQHLDQSSAIGATRGRRGSTTARRPVDHDAPVGILALGASLRHRRAAATSWTTLRSADGIGSSAEPRRSRRPRRRRCGANRPSASRRRSR